MIKLNLPLFFLLIFLTITLKFGAIETNSSNNSNNGAKLSEVLKNHTRSNQSNNTQDGADNENLLKQETHKLMAECGVESDDSNNYEDTYNNNKRNNNNKSKRGMGASNNYDSFGNNRRYNNHDSNGYGSSSNRNRGGYGSSGDNNNDNDRYYGNRNGGRKTSGNTRNDENDSGSNEDFGGRRRNNRTSSYNNGMDCDRSSSGFGNQNGQNAREQGQWRPYNFGGGQGYDERNYGYGGSSRRLRAKRSSYGDNDQGDVQCLSQCVFGYLEVLDDNRVPSETLVIKWLQEHYSNDMKRIRALREARRCFARLSTSDTEDGCEFSQSLSKCLNLELD